MSRPLLYMHLDKLEKAGLVAGQLELSEDGKAMKYFELAPFDLHLNAETIITALRDGSSAEGNDVNTQGPKQKDMPLTATQMTARTWPHCTNSDEQASPSAWASRSASARSTAIIVWAYFRLQSHRADAVAMAEYRKLAEEAVANQQELRTELAKLTEHVQAVEQLMRDVG